MKFRIANSPLEFEGEPEEIEKLMQKPELLQKMLQMMTHQTDTLEKKTVDAKPISSGKITIPTPEKLVSIIEESGKPFKFSPREQQIKMYGHALDTKREHKQYMKFNDAWRSARKRIEKKYNGTWDFEYERIEGMRAQSKRHIFKENSDQ